MKVLRLAAVALFLTSSLVAQSSGTVTIYRLQSLWSGGQHIKVNVKLDGSDLAMLEDASRLSVALPAGRHAFYSHSVGLIDVDVIAGEEQFLLVDFNKGFTGRTYKFRVVDPSIAAVDLAQTHPVPEKHIKAPNLVAEPVQ